MRVDPTPVLAAAFVLAVLGALAAGGATSTAAFGSFNPAWDGTSDLRSIAGSGGAEPVVVRDVERYGAHGDGDVAFVLAPDAAYGDAEADAIGQFVARGGTLVVAYRDDRHGADLLASVGASARPVGPVLRDEREHHRGPALPVASDVGDHPLVADVRALTLNHGTAVEPNGATVLVASSEYAYLDRDGDGSPGDAETVTSHPVATVERVGDGRVVVVGDPSVFINVMQGQEGNRAFTSALTAGSDAVLVDVSREGSLPPLVVALLTIRESIVLQLGLGLGAIAGVGAAGRVVRRRSDPDRGAVEDLDGRTVEDGVRRLHPSVDPARLRKLTQGVIPSRSIDTEDD